MTSREYFSSAMEASRELDRLTEDIDQRNHAMMFHGRSGQTLSHGVILDPMRNVDEALDANAEDEVAVSECEREIEDAWYVVGGISELGADEAANVICCHYLWLMSWPEIASSLGHTETECQALMEMALDWCDGVGIARLRDEGRKSPAKIDRGNRSEKSGAGKSRRKSPR